MRNLYLGFSFALVAAAGCGGDDGGGIHVPDAKVYMDAAIDAPPACVVDMSYPALSIGTMTTPAPGNHFDKITSGTYAGKLEFFLAGKLDMNTKFDALFIDVRQPDSGTWATGAPYAFQSDATSATYDADAYILGDIDTTANSYAQVLWASQGTITFTTFETPSATSKAAGSVTMTPMRQIDDNTGAAVAGGCTTSLAGLSFNVVQNQALPARQVSNDQKDLGSLGTLKARIDLLKATKELN